MKNKAFCAAPWAELVLRTNKRLNVCCNAVPLPASQSNIEQTTITDFFNGDSIKQIRQELLAGNQIDLCKNCYKSEELYNYSIRTDMNKKYEFFDDNFQERLKTSGLDKLKFPKHAELHVSNLCNLKCLTCNPYDSSQFLAEEKLLGNTHLNQSDFTFSDELFLRLFDEIFHSDTELIDLRGGETLMVPMVKQCLKDADISLTKNKQLKIQTNGTVFDDTWKEIFLKFESVFVAVSIDAFDHHNEYIRYPANWNKILNTLNILKTIENTRFVIVCTVSNLSWIVMPAFLDWLISQQYDCGFSGVIQPAMFTANNLPKEFLDQYTANIESYIGKLPSEFSNMRLKYVIDGVKNHKEFDEKLWISFCKTIAMRDNFRKNSIACLDEELWQYMKKFI